MEHYIQYDLYLNHLKAIKLIRQSQRKFSILLEDNSYIRRKDIKIVKYICTKCKSCNIIKRLPDILKDEKLCKSCLNTAENNPQFGKKWSNEKRLEKSINTSGTNNPMYNKTFYDCWLEKYGKDKADEMLLEQGAKCSRPGIKNGMYNKTFYDCWLEKYGKDKADEMLLSYKADKKQWILNNPDHLKLMILNSHLKGFRKTSIEIKIEQYLIENNLTYKYNFICNKKYQYDFLLKDKKIIIECHGDYWHANPNIYSDIDINKRKLNDRQRYKVNLDIIKNIFIKHNTEYDIIYLWETDIKNNNYKNILKDYGIN